jgi:hypothetical protein
MKGLDEGAFRALGTRGPPRAYLAILVLLGHLGLMSFTGLSALVGTTLPSLNVDLESPPPKLYLGPKSLKSLNSKGFHWKALEERGRFIY